MKHNKPQNLAEDCEKLREAWVELVKTVKAAFWQDVARTKKCWQDFRRWRALKRIRGTLLSFGITTAHMTNDELAAHVIFISQQLDRAFDKFGVSCVEAARSFQMLSHALRTLEIEKGNDNEND